MVLGLVACGLLGIARRRVLVCDTHRADVDRFRRIDRNLKKGSDRERAGETVDNANLLCEATLLVL